MTRLCWLGSALCLAWISALPVSAQSVVTMTVTGAGGVNSLISGASLPAGRPGSIEVFVSDERGLGQGWDIVLSLESPDAVIEVLGPHRMRVLAGQPVVESGPAAGPIVPGSEANLLEVTGYAPHAVLEDGTSVLRAGNGAGSGAYSVDLAVMASQLPRDTIVTLTVGIAP